jgi:putative exporter of polyketide antibiotics
MEHLSLVIWALLRVSALALGFSPRLSFAGWLALALCVVSGWFGVILGLPNWILRTSPFGHLSG